MTHRYRSTLFVPLTLKHKVMYGFPLTLLERLKVLFKYYNKEDYDELMEIVVEGDFDPIGENELDLISMYEVVNTSYVEINSPIESDITDDQLAQFISDAHDDYDYWSYVEDVSGDMAYDMYKDERDE